MEQKEFEQRVELITDLINDANALKKDIANAAAKVEPEVNELLPSITERNESFLKYLGLLKDFSFSDKLTTPSDLFPGIRTAAETADPEELNKKAEEMKTYAGQINVLQKKASLLNGTITQDLKRCLGLLAEYILQEDQIYDLSVELLQDADSIYDVGQIAKNT